MPPFLSLHALAARRGDGLRPELLALFERLAAASGSSRPVPADGDTQLGGGALADKSGRGDFRARNGTLMNK